MVNFSRLRKLKLNISEARKKQEELRKTKIEQKYKLQKEKTRIAELERKEKALRDREIYLRAQSSKAASAYRFGQYLHKKVKKYKPKTRKRRKTKARRKKR